MIISQRLAPSAFKANCLNCGKVYISQGLAEEFGQCSDCNVKENFRLLRMKTPYERKNVRKVFPHRIGRLKIRAIKDFVRSNTAIERMKRKDSLAIINEQFGTNLSVEEYQSLLINK